MQRNKEKRKGSRWTGQEASYLLDMAADGYTIARMAKVLRRSQGAVL